MAALRSFIHGVWSLVTVVPWAIMMILASIFAGGVTMYRLAQGWLWLCMQGLRVICGVKWRVSGYDYLPQG